MSGVPFESWIDRQIREAMEAGEFDNLPGAGQPLHLDSSPDWWIRAKVEREGLAPALPTPLALRREVAGIDDALADARTEAEARERCEDLNERVRAYIASPHRHPAILVHLVDVDAALRTWRHNRSR